VKKDKYLGRVEEKRLERKKGTLGLGVST